ncbi:MAG: hypothetical protein C0603_09240 [Denitrovibrio sp.]|nr:MAG: hypothetical protein C0603_09240 [Denitrovibrio sp.]
MKKRCFVIQPFNDKYYDYYNAIFEPAINDAGLEPYRVDLDLSKRIPIETIEKEIEQAAVCFAEISENNPNVWYELGYAFACEKDVVMVCQDGREKFPFDIQHRDIFKYKESSPSSYNDLKTKITDKLQAYLKTQKNTKKLKNTTFTELSDVNKRELIFINVLLSLMTDPLEGVSLYILKNEIDKISESKNDFMLALKQLQKKGLINIDTDYDQFNNSEYRVCNFTEKGDDWLVENSSNLRYVIDEPENQNTINENDMPF